MTTHSADRWVLGICPGPHDPSAALLNDGELVVMVDQEKFSRNKSAWNEMPHDAVEYCLADAGITLSDVTAVGIGLDVDRFLNWLDLPEPERAAFRRLDDPALLFPSSRFAGATIPPIHAVRHHIAHAASAFRASGFVEAAVVVIDNRGEDCSAIIGHGTPDGIEVLATIPVEDSIGLYYQTAAQYTGLGSATSASGKFMGLASYGRPDQPVPLDTQGGWPVLRLPEPYGATPAERRAHRIEQLRQFFQRGFPFEGELRQEPMAYANFAASVQRSLEESIMAVCLRAVKLTGCTRLCLAGGVALNCTTNGLLHHCGHFADIFVQPAANDSGTSLGAALEVAARLGHGRGARWQMNHAYWGPRFGTEEIAAELRAAGLPARPLAEHELLTATAAVISSGGVVGWFQGRAEIGPRALGARSVLASPARRSTLAHLNTIKGREVWRPLAPSVVEEEFDKYFEGRQPFPFMLVAAQVRPEVASRLAAVVHVDGSARPQAVARSVNPRFWELLSEVGRRTGDPVVINTSFNVAGEPIVNTPGEAIRDFLTMPLDALAIGDFLVHRDDAGGGRSIATASAG